MILRITEGMTRLALRIKEVGGRRQVTDWQHLQLLIRPGEHGPNPCCGMGSPWFLTGCWPGKRTNVDVANPHWHFDFPTIAYDAFELDAEGRVVFRFCDRLWALPHGRYSGTVRISNRALVPYNLLPFVNLGKPPEDADYMPPEYRIGQECDPRFPEPYCPPPPPKCCDLAKFDIDLGPACSDHLIDQVAVEFAIDTCGEI